MKESKNEKMSEKDLRLIYYQNPHGVGVLHYEENKAVVSKHDNFEDFYDYYKRLKSDTIVTHFRYATSGKKNKANIHPFPIYYEGNLLAYLFHNGIFREYSFKNFPYSDTFLFARVCEMILKEYTPKDLKQAYKRLDEIIKKLNRGHSRILVAPYDLSVTPYDLSVNSESHYYYYGDFIEYLNHGLFSNLKFKRGC